MSTPAEHQLAAFGAQHLIPLAIFVLGCAASFWLADRMRTSPAMERHMLRLTGVVMIIVCGPFELLDVINGVQHPQTSLPIQISDMAWFVAAMALLTRGRRWSALLYYWGLTLSVQAVITPDLHAAFPAVQYFGFWVRHLPPIWAAVYLLGARAGPTWRGYRFAYAVTAVWTVVAMSLNFALGSDYDYLNGKPDHVNTLLDFLGPWPWYVLVEAALAAGIWALLTWPWNRRSRARRHVRHGFRDN